MPPYDDQTGAVTASLTDELLHALLGRLGRSGVLTEPDDVASYLTDWTGMHHGRVGAVLRPRDTAQVSDAVRLCAEAGVAIVPQGGNTGLCGFVFCVSPKGHLRGGLHGRGVTTLEGRLLHVARLIKEAAQEIGGHQRAVRGAAAVI